MTPTLLLATNNPGKVRELRDLLAPAGWTLVTPRERGIAPVDVAEGGRSYLENAVAKAVAFAAASGLPALADDSGLEVDALEGRPGVLSARYGGPAVATDAARCALLLRELAGVPPARRTARFRAVVALALPGGRVVAREGTLEGRIALAPRGASGFGYDPVFELLLLPSPPGRGAGGEGSARTLAELGAEKQAISHRALAVRAMIDVLARLPQARQDDARSAPP
jgi:XTP/dITP diphosphohydrolase